MEDRQREARRLGPGGPRAWLEDGSVLPVSAATHEAVGLQLPAGATLAPEPEISLGDAHRLVGPVRVRVTHLERRADGSAFAVLRLQQLPAELRRQFADLLLSWPASVRRGLPLLEGLAETLVTDPRRIGGLIEAFGAEELPALALASPGGPYSGDRLRAAAPDLTSDLPLRWVCEAGPGPQAPFAIEVGTDDFVYELPVEQARWVGDQLCTDMPSSLLRVPLEARWLLRAPPEQGWEVVLDGGEPRPLARASASRLAFPLLEKEGARGGRPLRVLLRDRNGDSQVRGSARIQGAWPSPDSPWGLGMASFEPRTAGDRAGWAEALERIRNPDTRRAGTWAASLWELYDKSGYFQLSGKTAAHFSRLRRSFAVATRRLDTAPELGCQVVWHSPTRVEAALSMLFVYAGTAMVYQVARRRDARSPASARRMLRAINVHAFEHVSRDPAFEWTLVYVQEGGARWSHLAYQVFTESKLSTGLTCVLRFRAMEARAGASPPPTRTDVEAGRATEQERVLLAAMLPRLRPGPYLEALDLVPGRFDLGGLRSRWASAGFGRERDVLVARRSNRPLAAAIVESAEDALHLFGLLDSVRFYPLAPDWQQALPALVAAARGWFARRDKQSFVCFFEAETFGAAEQSGLYDLGAANLLAFPRLLLPDFLEHLFTITAARQEGH